MGANIFEKYTEILKRELIPATGCTEPIALALAAAQGRKLLGDVPDAVSAYVSGSIIKNVKSVIVPNTNGMKGIEAAIAAGITVGDPDRELEVLSQVGENAVAQIGAYLERECIHVYLADTQESFDILLVMRSGENESKIRIAGHHTNIVLLESNGEVLLDRQDTLVSAVDQQDIHMSIAEIYDYACNCDLAQIAPVIERQIELNSALSQAGLDGEWGAQIGRILLKSDPDDVLTRAKARAAAGSDARMSGCQLPAVINSGSGNQGLTITMAVLEYAQTLQVSHERLVRGLIFANLAAIRIKKEIGCLSAYCGAVCAGCAAGAGIAFLHGENQSFLEHTIVNSLAILSGTICDGAKPSCAAKIAMSVEAGMMGYEMAKHGTEFVGGDGIIKKGIENTIAQIGTLGRVGMVQTNETVLNIMLKG